LALRDATDSGSNRRYSGYSGRAAIEPFWSLVTLNAGITLLPDDGRGVGVRGKARKGRAQ